VTISPDVGSPWVETLEKHLDVAGIKRKLLHPHQARFSLLYKLEMYAQILHFQENLYEICFPNSINIYFAVEKF
jgi:hypothetical protein